MNQVTQIVSDINNGNIKPIYFLMGEESYYIDKIADYIEKSILTEEERGFNQMVLYGRDVTIEDIIANAKRFPMMAEKQVIIVKEAQHLIRTIDRLESYAENPQLSTVLVICYKYKLLDKRKKVFKALSKSGVVFESKKLYENQIAEWIRKILASRHYKIEPKASQMLVDFLGTSLSKINNELEKLMLVLPSETIISPEHIEENIGISKDFNNFELHKAIGEKNVLKVNRIINHFAKNQKSNPLVVTISTLNNYFSKLLVYHGLNDKTRGNVAKALKISPYFVDEYIKAGKNYRMPKTAQIISYLREIDVKSKGVGANQMPEGDLLKELMFKILH